MNIAFKTSEFGGAMLRTAGIGRGAAAQRRRRRRPRAKPAARDRTNRSWRTASQHLEAGGRGGTGACRAAAARRRPGAAAPAHRRRRRDGR